MRNLNVYNQDDFQASFSGSDIAKAVEKDFDLLVWDKHISPIATYPTPRHRLGRRVCTMTSFYYLQFLLEKNPQQIYDFGCGWNLFKKYIPRIYGVSPDNQADELTFFADGYDYFDKDYVDNHKDAFESAMSICALNYTPLSTIQCNVKNFISVIKPGGRGYIALDIAPMYDREEPEVLDKLFGTRTPIVHDIDDYVREQLSNLPVEYLVFDLDSMECANDVDGQIRIVFERKV
jgi:hypothetical protein